MDFRANEFVEKKLEEIKTEIGEKKALAAVSGGVDSTASAFLVHKVIGERLIVIFIDDGLMREEEPKAVVEEFRGWGLNASLLDAADEFFAALKGIEDPEEKRKAFRDIFYKVLGRAVKENKVEFLVQGTIRADVEETQKGIKTQHNVLAQIGLDPGKYGLQIIEPLKDLYKPQVREVAKALGLPEHIHQRMPFPGPGLATRVLGEVTPERVQIVRKATKIVEKEIKSLRPFQAFAVLLKDKATGTEEGRRIFGEIIVLRSVESRDALTATVTKVPWDILERIRSRITAEIPSVVKVVYDITPKPPSTIEYI